MKTQIVTALVTAAICCGINTAICRADSPNTSAQLEYRVQVLERKVSGMQHMITALVSKTGLVVKK